MVKNYKKESTKREGVLSEAIGGRRHVGSGAFWFKKGDASNEFIFIEDKFTNAPSYSLSVDTLHRLDKQASKEEKIPVFTLGFASKESFAFVKDNYIVEYGDVDITEEFVCKRKFITLKYDNLYKGFINSSEAVWGKLIFEKYEEIYFILSWDYFTTIYKRLLGVVS